MQAVDNALKAKLFMHERDASIDIFAGPTYHLEKSNI